MACLKRIILIHSHIEGVVELLLDDHANICGSNAAGKTTLQRLIPVFYGEQPNKVVPRTRKHFHQFYLPFGNSYLVYEYCREAGDTVMAVLARHSQTGVEYRFVASAYEPQLFLRDTDKGPQGLTHNELTAGLRRAGINHSRKFDTTSEYRSVILNDLTQLRGNNRVSRQLRQTALRYSLVEPGHRLRHMEKLVSAIHAKEGKMDTLKTMLAAIFEEDGVELPVTRLRNQQTQEWIRRMRQALDLDRLTDDFAHWEMIASALAASDERLHQIQPQLAEDARAHERNVADAAAKLQQADKALQQHKKAGQRRREQLREQQLDHRQACDTATRTLQDIRQRHDRYLENDMEGLARDVAQLSGWHEDRRQQAEHVRALQAEVGDARQEFDRHKAELYEHFTTWQQDTAVHVSAARTDLDALRQRHAEQREALSSRHQQRREQTLRDCGARDTGCRQELSEILTRLQASLLTPNELADQLQAQQRIEQCQQASHEAARQWAAATSVAEDAKRSREQALSEQQRLRQLRLQCENICYRLQQQFDPANGTLRHFLRDEMPGWEQHIGKLIREELLERGDLAPQRSDGERNLWGLQLDLGVIEAPDHALDEAALKEALAKASAERETAQEREDRHGEEVKRLTCEAQQREQAVQQSERGQQDALQDVDYALAARDRLQEELDSKADTRRKTLRDRQAALERQLQTLADEQDERLRQLDQDFSRQQLELRADNEEQEGQQQQRINDFQRMLDRRKADTEARVHELQAHFDTQLTERGIDTNAIHKAEQRLGELDRRIRQTRERSEELSEYQRFLRIEWQQQKPELVRREEELKALLQADADALEQAEREHGQQREAQLQTQRQWQATQRRSGDWLEALRPILERVDGLALRAESTRATTAGEQPDSNPTPQWGDQDERIERARQWLQEQAQYQQQLDKGLKQFSTDLMQGATDDFAQRLQFEIDRLEEGEVPHLLDYLSIYRGMLQILRDERTELLQQGRNIGGDLNKFFTVFRDLNRRIRNQSRRLSDEVANDLTLEGISRAEVQIRSTIDQLDFWQPLTRFARLYEGWEASGTELPGEDYLNALADVAELLRQDQQYTFESLLQLELQLTEGGNDLLIRSDRQLLESSSHGMAYMILCQFLLAFTRLLRGEADVTVHWPIDEIGTLAYRNVEQLFAACDANRIFVLGAFPNAESDVLTLFRHRYLIERESPTSEVRRLKRIEPRLSALAEKLNALQEVTA